MIRSNKVVYIKDICDTILSRYFPDVDSLALMFSTDRVRGTKSIVSWIKEAVLDFETYCPLIRSVPVKEEDHEFVNNYISCVEQGLTDDDVELVPKSVARISRSMNTPSVSASFWRYKNPVLYYRNTCIAHCIFHYPMYIKYTENGYLSKDSHIYGIDEDNERMFWDMIQYTLLSAIKSNEGRVRFPTSVDFFVLDQDITELRQKIDTARGSSTTLRIAYR